MVLWDLEPDTYHSTAEAMISSDVETHVRPGSIILLHGEMPSRGESRAALPGIVSSLRARGYQFVTLSELAGGG